MFTLLSQYNKLSDFPFLEAQANMVGDFSLYYYKERYGSGMDPNLKDGFKQMAEIMKNSGIESEAVEWVLNSNKE